jgi:hypothetical protein
MATTERTRRRVAAKWSKRIGLVAALALAVVAVVLAAMPQPTPV